MSRILLLLIAISVIAALPLLINKASHYSPDYNMSDKDKPFVEKIVEGYIKNNPEKIIDSIANMRHKPVEHKQIDIKNYKTDLENPSYPSAGSKDAKVTLVEFFDYSCGYCKAIKESIKTLIQENKVRFVFRDLPLNETSLKASRAALAVHMIDSSKYIDFYYKLLDQRKAYDDDSILEVVNDIGIKKEDFQDMLSKNSKRIEQALMDTRKLSSQLNIHGTPTIVIGGEDLVVGAVDLPTLRSRIEAYLEKLPVDKDNRESHNADGGGNYPKGVDNDQKDVIGIPENIVGGRAE